MGCEPPNFSCLRAVRGGSAFVGRCESVCLESWGWKGFLLIRIGKWMPEQ